MIEITQTRFAPQGNCYAACLASILEIDLEKLPRVPEDEIVLAKFPITNPEYYSVTDSRNQWWHEMWGRWFEANNLLKVTISTEKVGHYERFVFDTYHIINGPSPRDKERNDGRGGMMHSVVGKRGLIWFDPHPSRAGLLALDAYELIMPRDPAKPILEAYKTNL